MSHWYQAEPGGLGSRPWAWWVFYAPQPRRILRQWGLVGSPGKSQVVEAPITVDITDWPRLWACDRDHHFYFGRRNAVPGVVDFESERAYLRRLNLLTSEERASLDVEDDPEPEPPDIADLVWGGLVRRDLTAAADVAARRRTGRDLIRTPAS